jgi:uncharacterized caspase-like protein
MIQYLSLFRYLNQTFLTKMSRRLALVIGNNDYSKNELQNCVNDATKLAETLEGVSYTVSLQLNLKSDQMYKCIKTFAKSIQSNDLIIFFFAGHGVQWGDQNFLLPCNNDEIEDGSDMQRIAINAQAMVDQMADMNPHAVIVLLDCCREYWVPSSIARGTDQSVGGLHEMEAPPGTLIAFACAPGKTTPDRSLNSENGIFTKYLLEHIKTPGIDVEIILRRVAKDVAKETNKKQQPFRVTSIIEEGVYIVPPGKCLLSLFLSCMSA